MSAGCKCSVHDERAKRCAFTRKFNCMDVFDEWFTITCTMYKFIRCDQHSKYMVLKWCGLVLVI